MVTPDAVDALNCLTQLGEHLTHVSPDEWLDEKVLWSTDMWRVQLVSCHYMYWCHVTPCTVVMSLHVLCHVTTRSVMSLQTAHNSLTFSTANGIVHIRNFFSIFDQELKLKEESGLLPAA